MVNSLWIVVGLTVSLPIIAWGEDIMEYAPSGIYVNSPFHPQECGPARIESERQLRLTPDDDRWWRIFAEALLCDGLANDDPVSLREAVTHFRTLALRNPTDIDAAIGYADALRSLYPASDLTRAALEQALALVPRANRDLGGYLGANLATIRLAQAQCRSEARGRETTGPLDLCARAPEDVDVVAFVSGPGAAMPSVQRAEILRWGGRLREANTEFRKALDALRKSNGAEQQQSLLQRLRATEILLSRHGSTTQGERSNQ